MTRVLAKYENGNYRVTLLSNGTKIRETTDPNATVFKPERPETCDLSITDFCDLGCSFCYMGCTEKGKHADIEGSMDFLGSIPAGTEIAIGGGSPILHPGFESLLGYFSARGIISNVTVHKAHVLRYFSRLMTYSNNELLWGIGVSMASYDQDAAIMISHLPHSVFHVIAGIISADDIEKLANFGVPILILGYKNKGRAKYETLPESVEYKIRSLKDRMPALLASNKCVVSFDNLALQQLDIKSIVPEKEWQECYMGDDGLTGEFDSASFYVDLTNKKFAMNSVEAKQYDFSESDGTFTGMYNFLKGKAQCAK